MSALSGLAGGVPGSLVSGASNVGEYSVSGTSSRVALIGDLGRVVSEMGEPGSVGLLDFSLGTGECPMSGRPKGGGSGGTSSSSLMDGVGDGEVD